jgi:hypothetical protein
MGTGALSELERSKEDQALDRWRIKCLREAGYPDVEAELLAGARYVDLHTACDLVVVRHCPPELAASILL